MNLAKNSNLKPLLVSITIVLICFGCGIKKKEQEKNLLLRPSLKTIMDSLHLKKEDLAILIDKGDHRLYVKVDTMTIKSYAVVFGTNPVDDKLMQGDRATPEGKFKIRAFYPHKSWSKFIWIDYPTENSWEKHKKAKAENKIPQDASIGGEIGIHGVPNDDSSLITERVNWTWGCIAMTNNDINELYAIVYKDMPVEIFK